MFGRFNMTDYKIRKNPLPRDLNFNLMDSPDEVGHDIPSEYRTIV
jgi:hypothetical protein